MIKFVAAFVMCVISSYASAEFHSGNRMAEWISAAERVEQNRQNGTDYQAQAMLLGFVTGIADSNNGTLFCLSPNVTIGQLIAVLQKNMAKNPENWNLPAWVLVTKAFASAFPCAKK